MTALPPTPAPPFDRVEIPSKYAKAIVAILIAVLTVLVTAMADDVLDPVDLVNVIIAFLTAVGVYVLPNIENQTAGAWVKFFVAFVGTALQALLPFLITGDVTTQQWLVVLLSAIGALAVGIVPNVDPERVQAQQTAVTEAVLARHEAIAQRAYEATHPVTATPLPAPVPDPVVHQEPQEPFPH